MRQRQPDKEKKDEPVNDGTLLHCIDCDADFLYTDLEKVFYEKKGLAAPRRCKDCREKRKKARARAEKAEAKPDMQYRIVCDQCGIEAFVPFKPDPGRPVKCKTCHARTRNVE